MEQRVREPRYGGDFAVQNGPAAPFVLPGELVRRTQGPDEGLEVLESSPGRVPPSCVHFGACGGCHYQHADYSSQLNFKQQILRGLFADAGLRDLPGSALLAAEPWGYRNRIRMRVRTAKAGEDVQFGYSRGGTNEFLPIVMCPIAAPLLWRTVESLRVVSHRNRQVREWLFSTSEIELFTDADQKRVQMQLLLANFPVGVRESGGFGLFCESLAQSLPELIGAGAQLDPALPRRARRGGRVESWGSAGLNYTVGGNTYWVSRGSFFQVNRFLIDDLVKLVTAEAGERARGVAWDLYAGVGLFTRPLAQAFGRVVAVEGADSAAADLSRAAAGVRGEGGYDAVHMPALEFLRHQQTQRERPDVVVLDPPRAGLGEQGASLLANLHPAEVFYVSCDPQTLARDLRILIGSGYRVQALHLVDLFPQTFHIETVVRLLL